jgi:5-methyltetrahydropteroyltriglutamate--homocysteine methyltransferase
MRRRYQALLPTITGPIQAGPAFLVRDWRVAQSATRRPVKITVPGPLTIGDSVADEHYRDPRLRGAALADALNVEIRRLADAGCPAIQIDEPVFARKVEDALAFGIEHLERCFHKTSPSTERVVHICCGYPDRLDAEDYPKAPQAAYLELAPVLDEAGVNAVSIEDAHRQNDLGLLERFARTKVLLGVIAIARSRLETVEEVRARLVAAQDHIDAHRLIAAPDCGLGFLGRALTRDKLRVLAEAAHSL